MTAFGRVEDAVWAMKLGAVDFLTKPFKRQVLVSAVELALKRNKDRARSKESGAGSVHSTGLIGNSRAMVELRSMIEQVAATSATVLLSGESGTGKELASVKPETIADPLLQSWFIDIMSH
jgi:DNA-binding NtrC family response regulator